MDRPSLATELAARLRREILDGALAPGARLNEVHLAEALGVSRTPLREAIGQVAADGLLERRPRFGYFVRELDEQEFHDLYGMRRLLDPAALDMAGAPEQAVFADLEAVNRRIVDAADDAGRVIDLDDLWHRTLLAHCPNRILLEQIEYFIRRTRRYEHAYFREHANVGVAVTEHRSIQEALSRRDLPRAVERLRQNMTSGEEPIRRWLRRRKGVNT